MTYKEQYWRNAFDKLSQEAPARRWVSIEMVQKALNITSTSVASYYLEKMKGLGLVEHDEENNKWYIP